MTRTGLAAETCTRELAQKMAKIPALRLAFADNRVASWRQYVYLDWRLELCDDEVQPEEMLDCIPAPTVREMLAWLDDPDKTNVELDSCDWVVRVSDNVKWLCEPARLTDPDALAHACIEAAKAGV